MLSCYYYNFFIPYIIYCYLNCIIIIIIIIIYILLTYYILQCVNIWLNIFVTLDHKTSHKGHFFKIYIHHLKAEYDATIWKSGIWEKKNLNIEKIPFKAV